MIIEDDKVDLLYLPFIFELNENDLQYILQKSYYSDDSTLSLLFIRETTKEYYFMQYKSNFKE
jgi:hypothetical protein